MANILGGLYGLGVGFVLLLIGVALTGGGWYAYQDAQEATENAVEIEGTVVSSTVAEAEVENEEGSGTHTEYYPEIEYRYTYEGEPFTSTSICPGTAEGCEESNYDPGRDDAEAFVARYPEGETVRVYVLPEQPSRSFLVDTDSGSTAYYVMMGIGGIALFAGAASLLGGLKRLVIG